MMIDPQYNPQRPKLPWLVWAAAAVLALAVAVSAPMVYSRVRDAIVQGPNAQSCALLRQAEQFVSSGGRSNGLFDPGQAWLLEAENATNDAALVAAISNAGTPASDAVIARTCGWPSYSL